MSNATVSPELLAIIEQLPTHPTSGELLGAFVRAERSGFERGFRAATQHTAVVTELVQSAFLRRQAG
ncbi:MAG: hypothetical protein ACYDAE_19620 [Steroidobacteraceae bacterium]